MFGSKDAILEVLIRGEAYGLEVARRIADRTDGTTQLRPGRLYPMLRSLEQEGLVESRRGEPDPRRGGRPRVYYKLTAEGARRATTTRDRVVAFFGAVEGP